MVDPCECRWTRDPKAATFSPMKHKPRPIAARYRILAIFLFVLFVGWVMFTLIR